MSLVARKPRVGVPRPPVDDSDDGLQQSAVASASSDAAATRMATQLARPLVLLSPGAFPHRAPRILITIIYC